MVFPNEFRKARTAKVGAEIEEMTARINWIEAQILPFRHDP